MHKLSTVFASTINSISVDRQNPRQLRYRVYWEGNASIIALEGVSLWRILLFMMIIIFMASQHRNSVINWSQLTSAHNFWCWWRQLIRRCSSWRQQIRPCSWRRASTKDSLEIFKNISVSFPGCKFHYWRNCPQGNIQIIVVWARD